jgi:hypothetical protein
VVFATVRGALAERCWLAVKPTNELKRVSVIIEHSEQLPGNSGPQQQQHNSWPSIMVLAALSTAWLSNPWLVWGLGSYLASSAGFLLTACVLEWVLSSGLMDDALLCYDSTSNAPRRKLLAATQHRLPFRYKRSSLEQFVSWRIARLTLADAALLPDSSFG